MNEIIAVTGATGNVGRRVAEGLLAAGRKVRVLARTAGRLQPLKERGAEVVAGSLDDAGTVRQFFGGARSAFVMIPPNYGAEDFRGFQRGVAENYVKAIEENRVASVVALSSIGASETEGTGPILGVRDLELRLGKIAGLNAVYLRPAFFMENHLFGIPVIRQAGIYGTPLRPDVSMPMIATADIAAETVKLLSEARFTGKSARELLGPRDYTPVECARILGEAIGKKELKYVPFPYADAQKAMTDMGMSRAAAALMIEMYKGMNDGRIRPAEKRGRENTTPTTLEQFAKRTFAPAFQSNV